MADFCKECAKETGLPNDAIGLCKDGECVEFLCEGCGHTKVDHEGSCLFHKGRTSAQCCEAGIAGEDSIA